MPEHLWYVKTQEIKIVSLQFDLGKVVQSNQVFCMS